jgi:hypothetical protein
MTTKLTIVAYLLLLSCFVDHRSVVLGATAAAEIKDAFDRTVETKVVARAWPTTIHSLYCEAFVYHMADDFGHDFLYNLSSLLLQSNDADAETSEQALQEILQASSSSSSTRDTKLLEWALAMRSGSPTCEAHRSLAKQYTSANDDENNNLLAVVVMGSQQQVLNETDVLEWNEKKQWNDLMQVKNDDALAADTVLLLPNEQKRVGTTTIRSSLKAPAVQVILYANMGTRNFGRTYRALVESGICFVVRHLGPINYERTPHTAEPTVLQGYGVRLDIRNVEYKVFDDRSSTTTINNNETAQTALPDKLSTTTTAAANSIPPASQRKQLALQAAAVIAASKDPLVTLMDISQNLPSHAASLVRASVPPKLLQAARALEELPLLQPGLLYINGVPVSFDRPSLNIFEILDSLRKEQRLLQQMEQKLSSCLNYSPTRLRALQEAWIMGDAFWNNASSASDGAYRVDVARGGKGGILYVNDLEKDPQYAHYGTSLQQMMMSMQFGVRIECLLDNDNMHSSALV